MHNDSISCGLSPPSHFPKFCQWSSCSRTADQGPCYKLYENQALLSSIVRGTTAPQNSFLTSVCVILPSLPPELRKCLTCLLLWTTDSFNLANKGLLLITKQHASFTTDETQSIVLKDLYFHRTLWLSSTSDVSVTLKPYHGFTLKIATLKVLLTPTDGGSPGWKGNQIFCKLCLHFICRGLFTRPNGLKRNSLCSLRVYGF